MLEEANFMRKQAVAHTFFKHLGYKIEEKEPRISTDQKKLKRKFETIEFADGVKNKP